MTPLERVMPDGSVVVPVHFLHRHHTGLSPEAAAVVSAIAEPDWRVACEPGRSDLGNKGGRASHLQRTDDPRAVTCGACRKSAAFREECRRCGYTGLLS